MAETTATNAPKKRRAQPWIFDLLLIFVLLAGAFFRFSGIYWGEYQYLHPDERFLVWVGTDISPVEDIGEYFDTQTSSLNPHNRGHGFYVYGTLPMFLTRYAVEWVFGKSGFQEMTQVGRPLSAMMDLLTVFLVYLAAERLYDKRIALLAAAFSAAAVLPIQQSHFFTMDTFMNAFSFLAFYFAVRIATTKGNQAPERGEEDYGLLRAQHEEHATQRVSRFLRSPLLLPSLGFGIALGMAVASKLNAAPMAFMLPAAMFIYLLRLPKEERYERALHIMGYLAVAGFVSLLVFRIFQPYAFSGPGFLGLEPNQIWLDNLRSQRAQSNGNVDFPPAMQWARRPVWFSFQNMMLWGLGLPCGILAWAGFVWVGWRLLTDWKGNKDEWLNHVLIWGWTAVYFTWQSLAPNPTMRYQLPIYPTLAIFAGWMVFALYDHSVQRSIKWLRLTTALVAGAALLGTYAYAYAFSQIYVRPITRVAASRWIYQNIPGPISLPIQTDEGVYNQSLPVPYTQTITPTAPYSTSFKPKAAGVLSQIYLPRVRDEQGDHEIRYLSVSIHSVPSTDEPLATATLVDDLTPASNPRGGSYTLDLNRQISLDPEQTYNLMIALPAGESPAATLDSEIILNIQPKSSDPAGAVVEQSVQAPATVIRPHAPFIAEFQGTIDGDLTQLFVRDVIAQDGKPLPRPLRISILIPNQDQEILTSDLTIQNAPDSQGTLLVLESPLPIIKGETHFMTLEMQPEGGVISLSGVGVANEGEWDDGLPLRMDGYDGFAGIYPTELNFNMYWEDNPDKLARFTGILDQADYILISSSRQWGSLPRLPERFPLTTQYYRHLLGCSADQVIERCYNVAEPGMFKGNLGYELEAVFTSHPTIGPIEINDQFAEEAFTVYDHPKVFVFKKTEDYDPEHVRRILSAVDFSKVTHVPPMQAPSQPDDLMLPDYRLAEQREGGTWSELFDTEAPKNRFQALSVLVWYLGVSLMGVIVYPLLRLATPGLADHGYPMARTAGLLILSYLVWLAGSIRIPFTHPTISAALLSMTLLGAFLAFHQREELMQEFRQRGNYFLIIEGLTLAFFLAFLLVRLGNPDLWHPWKGGEKPMDFAYFNAVLKSTSFPPYDPWYAGGYLNYYYYGFVLVGVLVKWLGIQPAVAYNLILPTLFSSIAMGAFSLAWNLARRNEGPQTHTETHRSRETIPLQAFIPAIAAAVGTAVLGNLGTVRMFYQGYQKLVAPEGIIEGARLWTRWGWAVRGFVKALQGAKLPYSLGDWYWLPSRAIPALGDVEPITEFPYFTVLYADPHAHLLALPLTLLALGFIFAIVLGGARWKSALGGILWFLLAGLALGALRPTNTWDLYPYLALGVIAVGYALWANFRSTQKALSKLTLLAEMPENVYRALVTLGGMGLLAGLTFILYQPYAHWYALGYTQVDVWKGTHTPFSAYFTHWGLFLFVIVSWMVWETRDWMAKTPLSALPRLASYRSLILAALVTLTFAVVGLTLVLEVLIAWFALPLAAWAAVLLLRPSQPNAKRIVLFLVGSGLTLTLMVEVIVLVGDIGRMNTVFKFYLQAWTFLSISAAAALGWLLPELPEWLPGWRRAWEVIFAVLVASAALYPMMATMAKIEDRIAPEAPHSLDGMAFIPHAQYTDTWGPMELSQDYHAIRWMQENVVGSPVIVEANLRNLYRWGSRFSNYTGLPGVVGWEWHQQQQRAVVPGTWISNRIGEIEDFYLTSDLYAAADFLRKYDVHYIILGQQERGMYSGPGLEKFEAADGLLWREVYRYGDTVIYEVLPP